MSNMNVKVGSKGMIIALIIGAILLGGGGGYLLWRVNQPKTVAPTDSDAYEEDCVDSCTGPCSANSPGCIYSGSGNSLACSNCKEGYKGCSFTYYPRSGSSYTLQGCCEYERECNITAYHITFNAGTGGTVSPSGKQTVPKGSSTSSTATANTGYIFDKWVVGATDNTAPGGTNATLTISNPTKDETYTAKFKTAAAEKFTLKYTAGTGGNIVGNATQTVEKGKDGTAVEAKADTNYKFDKWSDNKVTTATRTDTNVQANITVKAEFKISCGDNICDPWEDVNNCPTDCEGCGDGKCIPPENAITCPRDCPVTCGDGICSEGEDKTNCPADCGSAATTVPDTGIFDNSKHTMIFGAVILVIGLAWTWISTLPKKAYVFVSSTSDNIREKKEKNIRDNRRSRLERRIK